MYRANRNNKYAHHATSTQKQQIVSYSALIPTNNNCGLNSSAKSSDYLFATTFLKVPMNT